MITGIALFNSPKCYILDNCDENDPDGIKRALKGVHHKTLVTKEDFLNSLYQNDVPIRKQVRLKRDTRIFKIRLVEEQKRALNPVYFKYKVSSDLISCSPHE